MIPAGDSLWAMVVRRVRSCETIFGSNVKISLRQADDEQLSRLPLPYLLVVPTLERAPPAPVKNDVGPVVVPRVTVLIAQFNAYGSDQEYLAAADMEVGRYQLLECLVNWRPFQHYDATTFAGMRMIGVKAPAVRVAFTFHFNENLDFSCIEESEGCPAEPFDMWLKVQAIDECPPEECSPNC